MLSFLTPYLAKIGIGAAILAAAVGGWLYLHSLQSTIKADQATISADSAKCANTQLAAAAQINAKVQAATVTQRQALDTALAGLTAGAVASQASGAAALATITAQAAQPSQDAPIAPVLQSAVAAVRGMTP